MVTIDSSEIAAISFSRMMSDFSLAPIIVMSLFPAFLRAAATGRAMAVPTPPPITTAVP